MTPNRKNNKQYPPPNNEGVGVVKNSNTSCHVQAYSSKQRREQLSRNVSGRLWEQEKYPYSSNSPRKDCQHQSSYKDRKINRTESEFIPSFVLVDACRENNERKVREICRKLAMLDAEEAEPVINFQDQTGRTALSYGCGCGSITIIDEVSKFRFADPNLPDNDGNAPLHYSSVCGHHEGIDLLFSKFRNGVDVNVRNASGLTPLMKAALQGRTRCAKSLLAAGANANIRDYIREFTAAEWARLTGRHMCAEIINRSASASCEESTTCSTTSSMVNGRTSSTVNIASDSRDTFHTDELPYYHLYARSTVSGAKWLKNKIKKVLGASVRSGEDKSFVYDNPIVRSLADRRPTISERNYTTVTNLGLGGATICASSLLLPRVQPIVEHQRQRPSKMPIPVVQITPVRR